MHTKLPDSRQNDDFKQVLGTLLFNTACLAILAAWGVELLIKALFSLS